MTKESDVILKQLATNAVNAVRSKVNIKEYYRDLTSSKAKPEAPVIGSKADLPIDELLAYIEGPSSSKKKGRRRAKC